MGEKQLMSLEGLEGGEERVSEIKTKVEQSQGKIVVCAREIVTRPLKDHYDSHNALYHTETGIIDGQFIGNKGGGGLGGDFCRIYTGGVSVSESRPGLWHEYTYTSDFAIPVNRKLSRGNQRAFSLDFPFTSFGIDHKLRKSDWESAGRGEIGFNLLEICILAPSFEGRYPYLYRIDFLFGEDEIKNWIADFDKVDDGRGFVGNVDDFFLLMKNPEEVDKRVDSIKLKTRQDLGRDLITKIVGAHLLYRQIKTIEQKVLRATYSVTCEGEDLERIGSWSDEQSVRSYFTLRDNMSNLVRSISIDLQKAGNLNLGELDSLDTVFVGIPGQTNTLAYLDYIQLSFLPEVEERLDKVNSYLRGEKRRKS